MTSADAFAEAALRTLGDAGSSVSDKDYAVRVLRSLGKGSVAIGYKSSTCAAASAGLATGILDQIYHGISLTTGVGCSGSIPDAVGGVIEDALQVM